MEKKAVLACAHAMWIWMTCTGLGLFVIAGWFPVPAPSMDAAGVSAMFVDDRMAIRIGISLVIAGAVFFWAFAAAISSQMRRMEGTISVYSDVQRSAAAGTVITTLTTCYLWLGMSFRPELVPAPTMQVLHDYTWLTFLAMWAPPFLQMLTLGFCILGAPEGKRVYPRWMAYFCFWMAILLLPGVTIPFFKTGPFAWNGLLGFYVILTSFAIWNITVWHQTVKAVHEWQLP